MTNEQSLRDYIWKEAKGSEPSHLLDRSEDLKLLDILSGDTLKYLNYAHSDGLNFYYKSEFIEFFEKFKDDEDVKTWFDEFGRDDLADGYIKKTFEYLTKSQEAKIKKMYKSFFDKANGIEKILKLASFGDALANKNHNGIKEFGDFLIENNFINKAERKLIHNDVNYFENKFLYQNLSRDFVDSIMVDVINIAYMNVAEELYDDYRVAQNAFDCLSPEQMMQQAKDNFGNVILAESPNGYEEIVKEIDITLKNFVDKYSETLDFKWKGDGQNRLFTQELTTLRNIVVKNIDKIQDVEVFLWVFSEKMHEMGVQFLNGYYNEQEYKDRLVDAQIPSLFEQDENKTKTRRKQ